MKPAPHDEEVVLSPEWVTQALGTRYPGVVVRGTTVTERLETVATKVRFRLDYAEKVDGAPDALCVKAYFNPASRKRGTPRTEVDFYQRFAADLPVRTPPCVYAEVDPDDGHALILMEDLVETGSRFLDPQVTYDRDRAAASLDQIARLHAATWDNGDAVASVFPPRLASLAGVMPVELLQTQLDDGRAPNVPAAYRDAERLVAAMHALAALPDQPYCMVHGDVHTGNIFETADGPGLIDWQVVQHGAWALDVGYHLACVLDPSERSRSERDLLDHYLDRLAAHGGKPPAREDAWWAYRAHLPYGYYLWGITRQVDRPITEQRNDRLSQAVAEHDSYTLLGV